MMDNRERNFIKNRQNTITVAKPKKSRINKEEIIEFSIQQV